MASRRLLPATNVTASHDAGVCIETEAWDRLPPKLQATMLKTTLAERILKSAAEGERDRERLREAALRDLAA